MSDETVGSVLRHKDTRYVQVRLDYMLLYRNETKAKVIRIMETWTAQKRADWYKQSLDAKEQGNEPPEDELWVTMSYEQFSIFAYGTVKHDSIKRNVDELVKEKHLLRRIHPTIPYGPPQYLLNIALLQKVLDEQELPSLIDDIGKIAPPRKKHTPPEKYPHPGGIDTPRVGGIKPPGTGDFSYPSNNRTENSLDNANNKDDMSLSGESDAPALIDFTEQKEKRKTDPRLPVGSSHSQADIGNDDEEDVSLQETQQRIPAVPKQKPDAGTRTSVVNPPVGGQDDSTSVQAHSLDDVPSTPAWRGGNAGSLPPVSTGAAQGQEKPKPKSDTREIQRRINEHRGYQLEEQVEIIRERKAIKTWCNLHTLEEYEKVMRYLTTIDKYWRKEENKYRIGGLTLIKATPEALARLNAPLPMAANGHNGHSDMEGLVSQNGLVLWQGQWMTEEEANETGFNGGFGLYK